MKKIYILFFILLGFYTANATNFVVSGAGSSEVNGTYVENGTYNGKVKYTYENVDDGNTYAIIWDCDDECENWHIVRYMGWGGMPYYVTSAAESDTPPSSNWRTSFMGDPSVPTVEVEGLSLSFSTSTFSENSQNDGSISNSITITHNNYGGGTFLGNNNEDFIGLGYATVTNLPTGLVATLVRTSSTSLTFSLKGNANVHTADISNLTLTFTDDAFSGGVAADVSNYNKSNLAISFFQEITVASSGADYTSIQAAINAASKDDVILLSAETFTEHIEINKQLTIKGKGIDKTIIQGAASYAAAYQRVVWVYTSPTTDITTFSNLTIRYGKLVNNNDWGAGISSYTPLVLNYCKVSENIIAATGADARGAGVYSNSGGLTMEGCVISENVCSNSNGGSFGAGVSAMYLYIVAKNSTFTDNTCTSNVSNEEGAGLWSQTAATLINCTFSNNTANKGAGIYLADNTSSLTNVISYGNMGSTGADLQNHNSTVSASNCILGVTSATTGSVINGTSSNVSSSDPLLNSFADNGGYSYTYSLQVGSPAIDGGISSSGVLSYDQRGYATNGTKDIGAYEYDGLGRSWKGTTNNDWSTSSNWFENSIPTTATNVIITDEINDVVISSSTQAVCKDLYIYSGATLTNNTTVGDDGSLSVSGDFTNNGTVSSGATSTIIFNGASAQTIAGVNNSTFQNVTIDNSNGVSITTAPTINGELNFTSGNIIASSQDNPVILETTSSVTGAADTKCIVGYCQMNTNSTSKYTFPIGSSSYLRTASVTPTSSAATSYIANYTNGSYGSFTYSQGNGTIDHAVATEYWDINRLSGSADCYIELSYDANTGADNNYADFIVAHYTSNAWESTGNTATVTGDASTGTVATTVAISSFSPFTRGSKSVAVPVPVELISFKANCINGNEVKLNWSTSMELNNDYFSVEKSENGVDFISITKVKGNGTTLNIHNYNFIDKNVSNKTLYYRLVQNDFDGKKTISNITSTNCSESNSFTISPNPSKGLLTINGITELTDVSIYNSIGELIFTKSINLDANLLDLTSLNNGVYLLKTSNLNTQYFRIVIDK